MVVVVVAVVVVVVAAVCAGADTTGAMVSTTRANGAVISDVLPAVPVAWAVKECGPSASGPAGTNR